MKILALITSRKNSKRLPGKNIKILGNKTLIEWTINSVKKIDKICDIIISTDDKKAAMISRKLGVKVPWMRPTYLSKDNSTSVDVAIHALDWYEKNVQKVDGILLLQPTSPFRRRKNIQKGINMFEKHSFKKVLGVSILKYNPLLIFQKNKNNLKKIFTTKKINILKKLKPFYYVNGSFYLISSKELRKSKSFFEGTANPLVINSEKESLDIDTLWDFKIAQKILKINY